VAADAWDGCDPCCPIWAPAAFPSQRQCGISIILQSNSSALQMDGNCVISIRLFLLRPILLVEDHEVIPRPRQIRNLARTSPCILSSIFGLSILSWIFDFFSSS
jgi:hypothetical protein